MVVYNICIPHTLPTKQYLKYYINIKQYIKDSRWYIQVLQSQRFKIVVYISIILKQSFDFIIYFCDRVCVDIKLA